MKGPNTALLELRALVSTYLEGSDDAPRAAELLDMLDARFAPAALVSAAPNERELARERSMFGCTAEAIDLALFGKSPREITMYVWGTLSNAQELIRREEVDYDTSDARGGTVVWTVANHRDANTLRQLINIAKYAMDKAVPR